MPQVTRTCSRAPNLRYGSLPIPPLRLELQVFTPDNPPHVNQGLDQASPLEGARYAGDLELQRQSRSGHRSFSAACKVRRGKVQKIYAQRCAKRNHARYLRTGRIHEDGNEAVHSGRRKKRTAMDQERTISVSGIQPRLPVLAGCRQ